MTPSKGSAGRRCRSRERGFSLIVALMMLIVIIILGISSAQMAINEERGARNDRDRQIAFQAAEAALKDAEVEILDPASPACTAPNQFGRGRAGSQVCFNASSGVFFAPNCGAQPSFAQGLCAYDESDPAYLSRDAVTGRPFATFYDDAAATVYGRGNTVPYGLFTGRTYPSQATSGMGALPLSKYPPRYIIEVVPKNVSYDTCTRSSAGAGCGVMFRVTAMGFGANANSQVVLQSIVNTPD